MSLSSVTCDGALMLCLASQERASEWMRSAGGKGRGDSVDGVNSWLVGWLGDRHGRDRFFEGN